MKSTDNAAHVGKHKFELAGLGCAPFRFTGMTQNLFRCGDTVKPGGSCDYCATGITFECWVESADGKRFKVGSDCINKVGDAGLYRAFKTSKEHREHQRKLRVAKATEIHDKLKFYVAEYRDKLAGMAHPMGYSDRTTHRPLSALDYANWMLANAGAAGRASAYRLIVKLLNAS